jgi:hypothetical protein
MMMMFLVMVLFFGWAFGGFEYVTAYIGKVIWGLSWSLDVSDGVFSFPGFGQV